MLEVSVRRPDRAVEPGRDEDAERGQPVRIHVEEAEDLRFGVAEGVEDGARLEGATFGQLDHHLHADGPLAPVVARREPEMLVELPADRPDRTVADDGERGAHVHAGQEARVGAARRGRCPGPGAGRRPRGRPRSSGLSHRRARPDLHQAGSHHLGAHPLGELAHGEQQAAVLAQERRDVGEAQRIVLDGKETLQQRGSRGRRAAARPSAGWRRRDRADRRRCSSRTGAAIGISRRVEIREGRADPAGAASRRRRRRSAMSSARS